MKHIHFAASIALLETPSFFGNDNGESEVFQILNTKNYLPDEDELPKSTVIKDDDNDATYILSKLSDQELIKLLSQEPKRNEYDINDIVQFTSNSKAANAHPYDEPDYKTGKEDTNKAFFKLEDKEVEPFNYNAEADPKYNALQRLNHLLYSRPQQKNSDENDEKDEMLFDVLVSQLKSLCCKKNKPRASALLKVKSLLKKFMSDKKIKQQENTDKPKEHIFLVINDEIKSLNDSEDLIIVDPESLSKNSSVLLLGPISNPLSEVQLKVVMNRITNELSKPEYLPLLRKISEGSLESTNLGLMKSLITSPDSRRYIKPHRCNHQSKLARVYGGPKWLICTGYLNINTPSLYD